MELLQHCFITASISIRAEEGSRVGSFASIGFEAALGIPFPALLTAVTLNSYSISSTKPPTAYFVSGTKQCVMSINSLSYMYSIFEYILFGHHFNVNQFVTT